MQTGTVTIQTQGFSIIAYKQAQIHGGAASVLQERPGRGTRKSAGGWVGGARWPFLSKSSVRLVIFPTVVKGDYGSVGDRS